MKLPKLTRREITLKKSFTSDIDPSSLKIRATRVILHSRQIYGNARPSTTSLIVHPPEYSYFDDFSETTSTKNKSLVEYRDYETQNHSEFFNSPVYATHNLVVQNLGVFFIHSQIVSPLSGLFRDTIQSTIARKPLTMTVQFPKVFVTLLKWIYNPTPDFNNCQMGSDETFQLLILAKHFQMADLFYFQMARYFTKNEHLSLNLSRFFHHSVVPFKLLCKWLAITTNWEHEEKLGAITWWSRSYEDDTQLHLKKRVSPFEKSWVTYKDETIFVDICEVQKVAGLYIDFEKIGIDHCNALTRLLPRTFKQVLIPF